MNCPACHSPVNPGVLSCPSCNQDLTLFRTIEKMKGDLARAQEAVDQSVRQLNAITEETKTLEKIALKSTTVRPPEAKKISDLPKEMAVPKIPTPATPISRPISSPPPPRPAGRSVETNLGQKWFLVIGVILTVVGISYFLKYSFDQNWIGPAGRVAMAYLASVGLLLAGETFRKKKLDLFGYCLIAGGIASLYFSSYAGFQIYGLISQATAFALMILVTVLGCALALVHNNKWIAVLSLVGGFLTPLLLSTGVSNQVVLMTYLAILDLGILGLVLFKRWHLLTYIGFVLTWLYFAGWYLDDYSSERFQITLVYLNIFFVIFAVAPFLYYLRKRDTIRVFDFAFTFPNGFIALGFSYDMISGITALPMTSAVSVSYALLFLVMGTYLYKVRIENRVPLLILLSKGLLFLVITVPLLFDGRMVTVFWAIQAACFVWMGLKLDNRWIYLGGLLLLCLSGALFLMDSRTLFFQSWHLPLRSFGDQFAERWITMVTVLGSFLVAGLLSLQRKEKFQREGGVLLMAVFLILLFYSLSGEVRLFFLTFATSAGQAGLSVFWALFAIVLMIVGFSKKVPSLRKASIGLFAVTIAKVVFVDMRNISTPYRIVSFIVLGLLLLGASYLYYRQREVASDSALDKTG